MWYLFVNDMTGAKEVCPYGESKHLAKLSMSVHGWQEGGYSNKKKSYWYMNSHYKGKLVSGLSFIFYNGYCYIWKDYLSIEIGPWRLIQYEDLVSLGIPFTEIGLIYYLIPKIDVHPGKTRSHDWIGPLELNECLDWQQQPQNMGSIVFISYK